MGDYTLDIAEVQVLIHYPGDPDGFNWHHRILLHRITGGVWLTLTPDHDIQRHDLNTVGHRILERRSVFPDDIAAEIYAHDPISKIQLNQFKKRAKTQAAILGEAEVEETESFQWLVCESSHPDFGTEIGEDLLFSEATGLAFSQKGVVIINGEEVFVERVPSKDVEDWRKLKGLETGDQRLLGNHTDASGKKRLELSAAVSLMKGSTENSEEFPIAGVRAAKEYHEAVSLGANSFLAYHEQWLRLSGVQKRSSAAHIHRNVCEGLRMLHSFDQVDASTTAIGEHLSRWGIQTELAVERNPTSPDYSGLDVLSGNALQGDGRASTSKFSEWVTSRLKERSQIWKQERLYAQERRAQKGKGKGAGGGDGDSDDEPVGKRKKKKKGKDGGNTAGGSQPPAAT